MNKRKKITSFFIESLGCAKNTVDSHAMEKILVASGYVPSANPNEADVVIVNTCGFINPARTESIHALQEFSNNKRDGQFLIAAGCMSEREKTHLDDLVDGLDAAISTRRWGEITRVFHHLEKGGNNPYFYFPVTGSILPSPKGIPGYAIQGKSAYLKIADGCDRACAYCAIPFIKGPMVSRSSQDILDDVVQLEKFGINEIILIAQDSTAYGRDLGLHDSLPDLLLSIQDAAPNIPWIRIMYTFPGSISERLIEVIASSNQIVPYLDIPLQHAHPDTLKRMRRPSDIHSVKETLQNMRTEVPNLALRTTFIVGFPGETEAEFAALVEFAKEIEFDHVGIFPYYHEPHTAAFQMSDDVPENLKDARIQTLAAVQEEISLTKNQSFIGEELEVLVEGFGDGISIGRSYRDAPEIDGLVLVQGILQQGDLVQVRIKSALVHDLIAETQP
jgi:ribosomal protein S12 methylthiotransferase